MLRCLSILVHHPLTLLAYIYAAYLLQPDRVLVRADICYGYYVNSV